ncbi:hypothetical protein [Mycobacterium riyadhense]|uniref:hypothetical protein n=1 Tax=Mycobacterium riyadhense TaxID=486698 RepID=UPI002094C5DA|nr:hypothetical protein [Mycobacterium riyadhense]
MAQDRQRCGDHDVAWWQLDLVGSDDEVDPPPEIATSAGDALLPHFKMRAKFDSLTHLRMRAWERARLGPWSSVRPCWW